MTESNTTDSATTDDRSYLDMVVIGAHWGRARRIAEAMATKARRRPWANALC